MWQDVWWHASLASNQAKGQDVSWSKGNFLLKYWQSFFFPWIKMLNSVLFNMVTIIHHLQTFSFFFNFVKSVTYLEQIQSYNKLKISTFPLTEPFVLAQGLLSTFKVGNMYEHVTCNIFFLFENEPFRPTFFFNWC